MSSKPLFKPKPPRDGPELQGVGAGKDETKSSKNKEISNFNMLRYTKLIQIVTNTKILVRMVLTLLNSANAQGTKEWLHRMDSIAQQAALST